MGSTVRIGIKHVVAFLVILAMVAGFRYVFDNGLDIIPSVNVEP